MLNKTGICIGINDYPGTNNDLHGCVNDAMDWKQLLDARGYQTTAMYDQEATRDAIMTELNFAVSQLRYRDTLVVTYSGHGSWVPDRNGDEADDRDEVWVAYDFRNGGLILDDELYEIFDQRPYGSRIFVMSDSCFSGSVTRSLMSGAGIDFDSDVVSISLQTAPRQEDGTLQVKKTRFMNPDQFLDGARLQAARAVESAPAKGKPRSGAVLISGCSDQEYSYDAWFNGRPGGAFTQVAVNIYNTQHPTNIGDWYKLIRSQLPSNDYPQSPQLTAASHQKAWML